MIREGMSLETLSTALPNTSSYMARGGKNQCDGGRGRRRGRHASGLETPPATNRDREDREGEVRVKS